MSPADAPASRIDRASALVCLGVTLIMGVVLLRVVQLQVVPGTRLERHLPTHTSSVSLAAPRGEILDRRGRLLATTRFARRIIVDPTILDPGRVDQTVIELAEAAGLDPALVGDRVYWAIRENQRREEEFAFLKTLWPSRHERRDSAIHAWLSELFMVTREPAREPVRLELPDRAPLLRYLRVGGALDDTHERRVRDLDLRGVTLERVGVREYPAHDSLARLVGLVGAEEKGLLGAEYRFDPSLRGTEGSLTFVRDVRRNPLWVEDGSYVAPERGSPVRLSIDVELQRIAAEELARGVEEADGAGGRLVLLDPATGEVLAMVDMVRDVPGAVPFPWADKDSKAPYQPPAGKRPRYQAVRPDNGSDLVERNRCLEDVYEPGSTFKPFVWATVLMHGKVRIEEVFDTEGGHWRTPYGRPLEDEVKRERMRWDEVLVLSSNIGMVKGAERLSFTQLRESVLRFGFGRRTGLPLPGEASGLVTPARSWSKYTQTSVAFGHEVAVTPIQMARAFCAFARAGDQAGTIPALTLSGGSRSPVPPAERVIPPDLAEKTRVALTGVVARLDETIARANPDDSNWRYSMFGKSGTAAIALGRPPNGKRVPRGHKGYLDRQYAVSFVAGAPFEDPRLVVVVVVDDPGPARVANRTYFGSHVSGPIARRVMERSLAYLGVPPSPRPEDESLAEVNEPVERRTASRR